jgi:hypothetical protein
MIRANPGSPRHTEKPVFQPAAGYFWPSFICKTAAQNRRATDAGGKGGFEGLVVAFDCLNEP